MRAPRNRRPGLLSHLVAATALLLALGSPFSPRVCASGIEAAHGAGEEAADAHAPGSGGHDNPAHSLFDPKTIVWTVISFLFLMGLLKKTALPALDAAMRRREAALRDSIEGAERARNEARSLLDQYQARLDEARRESQAIIEDGRKLAEQARSEAVDRAQEEASTLLDRARQEIEQAKLRGIDELKSTVAELSLDLASRVIETELDAQKHQQLVQSFIDDLGTLAASPRR